MIAGCGGGGGGGQQQEPTQEEEQGSAAELVTGSFVGKTSDPDTLVAVVADEALVEGEDAREVRDYLCDGKAISEWFKGEVSGNTLDLTSEETGAKLSGELTAEAATGSVTLADGESFTFEASPATGMGGLYNVNIFSEGEVSGSSETGGRLEGEILPVREGTDDVYPIDVIITPPNGEPFESASGLSSNEAGEYRWIILPDGFFKGAKRTTSTGSSSGFMDPTNCY